MGPEQIGDNWCQSPTVREGLLLSRALPDDRALTLSAAARLFFKVLLLTNEASAQIDLVVGGIS